MSKILRAIIFSAYTFLLFQYIKIRIYAISKDIVEIEYVVRTPNTMKQLLKDLKKYGYNATVRKLVDGYEAPKRLPTDLKYILKWTEAFNHYSGSIFGNGQLPFINNRCEYYNCFFTTDKSLLIDQRNFDAILFDVEDNNWDDRPILRAPHQFYVFVATESASNFPVCNPHFDTHYNLTWTYKLDSDIRWSYLSIRDKKGHLVGPAVNMTWVEPMKPVSENVARRLFRKKKAAAWFVSSCKTKSQREKVATKLNYALEKFKQKVDIFGWCGHMSCPKDRQEECLEMLEEDYYFYLSFENSLSEDYVTEKLLHPLAHYTVPIVYGGANYSRFLPAGSYLNARELNATQLAATMNIAMKNNQIYQDYLRWRNYYDYQDSSLAGDICSLCKILNQPSRKPKVVKDFRNWWNTNYEEVCIKERRGHQMNW